ncbi:MAG: acyltransferase family protein, partial [Blastomonas sp.]|nr:acyltransferase family protein [Blastomonas sp.]
GLLIFYHIGLYFAPGPWLVKWPEPIGWIAYPVAAIAPWRLMVLFAVSGFASAAMLARASGTGAFFRQRSARLLIPLLFGTLVIVPPQDWVRLQVSDDYHGALAYFWTHQELSFRFFHDAFLPNWEHLWFLAYLWAYTALLALVLACLPASQRYIGSMARWLAQGRRIVLWPLGAIMGVRAMLYHAGLGDVQRYNDLIGDAHFIPAFLLGFLLARHPVLWQAIDRNFRLAAAGSVLCLIAIMLQVGQDQSRMSPLSSLAGMVAESAMAWLMLPIVFHLANRLLQVDHRWRSPLSRAVFPFYIVHQTVIVLLGFWLLPSGLPSALVFAILLGATLGVGMMTFWLSNRYGWIGLVMGVPPRPNPPPALRTADAPGELPD